MWDYMTALQDRFQVVSQRTIQAEQESQTAYDTLHAELSREQRKLLLRFVNAEDRFREEKSLDSFISGFRLSDGIRAELAAIPVYSFDQESEDLAREAFTKEDY